MGFRRISGALVALMVTFSALGADLEEELFAAARKGDAPAMRALLDKGVDVNAKWRYDTTALLMASMRGHVDAVKLLLDRGANVNIKDTFYGQTPLLAAASKGSAEVVKMLLAKGAEERDSALLAGVGSKNLALVKVVLEAGGVKPETLTEAVTRASSAGQTEMVEALKKAGAIEGRNQ